MNSSDLHELPRVYPGTRHQHPRSLLSQLPSRSLSSISALSISAVAVGNQIDPISIDFHRMIMKCIVKHKLNVSFIITKFISTLATIFSLKLNNNTIV